MSIQKTFGNIVSAWLHDYNLPTITKAAIISTLGDLLKGSGVSFDRNQLQSPVEYVVVNWCKNANLPQSVASEATIKKYILDADLNPSLNNFGILGFIVPKKSVVQVVAFADGTD